MESFLYPTNDKFSEGWSCSWRPGIWWSWSFEKIGASEITGCHSGYLVSLTDCCDFILCLQGWHNEPSYQWDPMWALSIRSLLNQKDCFLLEANIGASENYWKQLSFKLKVMPPKPGAPVLSMWMRAVPTAMLCLKHPPNSSEDSVICVPCSLSFALVTFGAG